MAKFYKKFMGTYCNVMMRYVIMNLNYKLTNLISKQSFTEKGGFFVKKNIIIVSAIIAGIGLAVYIASLFITMHQMKIELSSSEK